jgi:hypothetical protein
LTYVDFGWTTPCSAVYFIETPTRLANDCYFSRLHDIIRKPEGMLLLVALSEAQAQLLAVFDEQAKSGRLGYRMAKYNRSNL